MRRFTLIPICLPLATSACVLGLLAASPCAATSGSPESEDAEEGLILDGARLYVMGCASCHGAAGGGLSEDHPSYATFENPPTDFTDPMFNSREPAADWFLVVKHGGRALGLSNQMPAYGSAYSDEQISSVVDYVKSLAPTAAYPPGELNFLRPVRTIKAFPENELLLLSRYESESGAPDAIKSTVYFARRFLTRGQYEIKASTIDRGRAGREEEVELGVKWAHHFDLESSFLAAAGAEVEIPLDDEEPVFIPYWSAAKGLGEWFTLQGTIRSHLPADDLDAGDVELAAVVHWLPAPWPRRPFPALEAVVTAPFDGADLESSLLPQLYIGLTKGGHVSLAAGAEIPLSDQPWDVRYHLFLVWEYVDGPIWSAW